MGLNLNLGQTLLKERIKINLHANYSQPKEKLLPEYEGRSQTNLMYNTLTRNPTDPVFNPDGTYNNTPRDFAYINPFLILKSYDISNEYKNLNTSGNVTVNIIEGLDFSFLGGFTINEKVNKFLYDRNVIWEGADSVMYQKTTQNQRFNMEPSLQYFRKLFSNDYVKASVGYCMRNETTEMNYRNDRAFRAYFDENTFQWVGVYGIDDFESYTHDYQNMVGQLEYGLQNRYFLNVKANYEMYNLSSTRKYSPFPPDTYNSFSAIYHKPIETTGFYPSVTAIWKVSNETFMKSLAFLNNLEWKVGYGNSGNNIIDQIYYEQHLVNAKDIENEKMREFSTGIDFAFLENRVSGSVNYYNRETDNVLFALSVPVPPNTFPYTYKNGLTFQNSGLEGRLSCKVLNTDVLNWTSIANFSWNKINVENLPFPGYRGRYWVPGTDYFYTQTLQNNQPYWVFYLPEYAGISTDGQTLFYRDNGEQTRDIRRAEKRMFGQVIPKFEFGWANNLVLYKNVEVSLSMRYVSGHSIYNATRMYLSNPSTTYNMVEEALEFAEQGLFMTTASNYFLEKANFLRLDYITVGYNLKPKFMGIEGNIKLYAGANNLFTLTRYKGLDPAFDFNAAGNDNFNVYPLARSFVVGVKAVF
jgi:iron complex outermembrane receptor protein